ncbi:MAG: hypothetical protein ABIE03_03965 [Patescibacteria group bacterium]|nr:hypothetical protein [Patescibacteria group bacterium]
MILKKLGKVIIIFTIVIGTSISVYSVMSDKSLDIRDKAATDIPSVDCPSGKKCVALIIGKIAYEQVQPSIDQFIKDAEAREEIKIFLLNDNSYENYTPEQIRDVLIDYYNNKSIQGAILVGRIPYSLWENGWDENKGVNSFFYEDLDGSWYDNDSDGYYDYHTWGTNDGPEIWVSWIYPSDVSPTQNTKDLTYFFSKTHDYYTGNIQYNERSLIMLHTDWSQDMDFYYEKISDIYGPEVDTRGGFDSSGNRIEVDGLEYLSLIKNPYQMTLLYVHGDNNTHYPNINHIKKEKLEQNGGGSIITFIGGCHTGDLLESKQDIPIAETYLFRMPIGLVSTATTWSYGPEELQEVTEALNENINFADAWFSKQTYRNNSTFYKKRYGDDFDPNIHMFGEILFGNPLIKLNEPSCIPNCQEKTCGDDGCRGNCGNCISDEICSENVCIPKKTTCSVADIWGPKKKPDNKIDAYDLSLLLANWKWKKSPKDKQADIWGAADKPDAKVNSYDLSKVLGCWTKH